MIKKGLYYVEKMKELSESQVKNIREELIKFKNELIRKNRNKKDLDDYSGNTKYRGIKDIRYLFNEEDIYNSINNIKYSFDENEDKLTHNDIKRDTYYAEKIKKNKIKVTNKESSFKSIIENIRRCLYYAENMLYENMLSTSDIKEKLRKFKNEPFKNNNKFKKGLNEYKVIKYIRYLFDEDKNKKADLYMAEKMKNIAVKKIYIYIKDLNEYKGMKDIRYFTQVL